jgi:hypothetical protein
VAKATPRYPAAGVTEVSSLLPTSALLRGLVKA